MNIFGLTLRDKKVRYYETNYIYNINRDFIVITEI